MTYEELKVQLDINDPASVLMSVGKRYYSYDKWFVVCDDGDCHLFKDNGRECDIREVKMMYNIIVPRSIKKVVIPDSVTNIMKFAFASCNNLISVTIPDSVTSIGSYAFEYCNSLTSMVIGNSVKNIRPWAFYNCSKLESVVIPDNVMYIGEEAFRRCRKLTHMMIPDNVMYIGYDAFSFCNSLTSMVIGDGVKSIGEGAFKDCDSFEYLAFKRKTLRQVKAMDNYPWGINDESIIKCI